MAHTAVPPLALALILAAAVLHALWNAVVKGSGDRAVAMAMVNFAHGLLGLAMVVVFLPPSRESWPFLLASTLIHFFYYAFLLLAYRNGDLSQVYPIARGSAPLLVSVGGVLFADEWLSPQGWAGVVLVSAGILIVFFARGPIRTDKTTIAAALLTGLAIASYSVADGLGVRASQAPFGYIGWLFLLEWFAGVGLLWLRRRHLYRISSHSIAIGLTGGFISATAYGLAIYAKTLTQLGAVSAIRESSVIIAALIGALWFKERPWKMRFTAAGVVAAGVIVIAFG